MPSRPPIRRRAVLIEAIEARTLMSAAPATVHPDAVFLRPAAVGLVTGSTTTTTTTGVDDVDGFSPAQVRTAYGFAGATFGGGTVAADGSGQTIAIIDAYNDPNIKADLGVFDAQYGLAAPPSFKVVNQTGGTALPATDADWAGEISLDVEWAHAIAPGANILLVETNSDGTDDLLAGVNDARATHGVSVVSMSWGGSEYVSWGQGGESSTQTAYDADFTTPAGHQGVTFVAAAGDSGQQAGVQWPASSPNVLSVGGTTLTTADDGTYQSETGWSGTSSGYSQVETEPAYQRLGNANTSGLRAVADVSYDGDANTGFKVYDSVPDTDDGTTYVGWAEVGGTSAGSPQWAALIAVADQGRAIAGVGTLDGPTQTLPDLYGLYAAPTTAGYATYTTYFNDVTSGGSGSTGFRHGPRGGSGNSAAAGYDLVTGLGTPKAAALIDDLATSAAQTTTTTTPTPTATGLSTVGITLLTDPVASVVGGTAAAVKVRLTNSATTTFTGPITVTLSASTDGVTLGTTLTSVTLASVTLRPGASRALTLKFVYSTELTTGNYYLVAAADATATGTEATTAVTPAVVSVTPPTVDFSVAFVGTAAVAVDPGKKDKAVVRLTNVGNVTAKGTVTVTLSASVDGALVTLGTFPRKVKIAANRGVTLSLPFTTPADLTAGTDSLVATVTSATSPADTNTSNDTATTATRAA